MRTDCYSSSMRGPGSLETVTTACHLFICCRFRVCLSRIVKPFAGAYRLTIACFEARPGSVSSVAMPLQFASGDRGRIGESSIMVRPRVTRLTGYNQSAPPSVINGVVSNACREFRSAAQSTAFRLQLKPPFFVEAALKAAH